MHRFFVCLRGGNDLVKQGKGSQPEKLGYGRKSQKFCGGEDSVQWLENYISKIEGSGGSGEDGTHLI